MLIITHQSGAMHKNWYISETAHNVKQKYSQLYELKKTTRTRDFLYKL